MSAKVTLKNQLRRLLIGKRECARKRGDLGSWIRISAILDLDAGRSVPETAATFAADEQTVRNWVGNLAEYGISSLDRGKSPGRPPKLTKSQRKELENMIDDSPTRHGFTSALWRSPMIQRLIHNRFNVFYSVKYIAELLKNMGFSFQKAKFVSDHLDAKKRKEWLDKTWPKILREAEDKDAWILFGDEASFPQWGSLSYTWAKRGRQPEVKTAGKRQGYKVFGLIEYFTGRFFYKAQAGKLNSETYEQYLTMVLKKTKKHLIVIQDGARYHTSEEMQVFFYQNRDRLSVYQLPAYSPDLNPIEKLWKKIKEHGIHLHYFPTFEDLCAKVDSMLMKFSDAKNEVLSIFGLYDEFATR